MSIDSFIPGLIPPSLSANPLVSLFCLTQVTAESALTLRVGYIVERHLMDGDTVLFNRQPSLHKVCVFVCSVVFFLSLLLFLFSWISFHKLHRSTGYP